jgi:hypothetical protein
LRGGDCAAVNVTLMVALMAAIRTASQRTHPALRRA